MPTVRKSVIVARPREALFALVERCEDYPEFLPWCCGAQVYERDERLTRARLCIDYHGLRSHIETRNEKHAPERIGLGLTAYINVRLEKHTESHKRNPMDAFKAAVQAWPEVVECAALTGEKDFLLRVVVAVMAHYSRFIMDTLLKHPSVQDCKTSFVLDRVKATTAVPI